MNTPPIPTHRAGRLSTTIATLAMLALSGSGCGSEKAAQPLTDSEKQAFFSLLSSVQKVQELSSDVQSPPTPAPAPAAPSVPAAAATEGGASAVDPKLTQLKSDISANCKSDIQKPGERPKPGFPSKSRFAISGSGCPVEISGETENSIDSSGQSKLLAKMTYKALSAEAQSFPKASMTSTP